MTTPLSQKSIAILAANGFDENHMTAMQRALTKMKAPHKIVAPEQGLVNGWQDNSWGHYFTVDESIGSAMGSDFDALVLIGGSRGIDKLKGNLHTRRIVNHFLESGKPVAAIGEGVALLALSPKSAGLEVAAPDAIHDVLLAASMVCRDEAQISDQAVLTSDGSEIDAFAEASMVLFEAVSPFEQEEAA